jgi:hypothetical protein
MPVLWQRPCKHKWTVVLCVPAVAAAAAAAVAAAVMAWG